jgi:hypothetical protein
MQVHGFLTDAEQGGKMFYGYGRYSEFQEFLPGCDEDALSYFVPMFLGHAASSQKPAGSSN